MRKVIGLGFVVTLVAAGCGGGEKKAAQATQTTAGGCEQVKAPPARKIERHKSPSFRLDAAKHYVATVETTCGTFEITLDAKHAPRIGGSFVSLAREGFFGGLGFHRVAPGFVIQGGDPAGDGSGGPGYTIRESPPRDAAYVQGVVAMAKTQTEPAGTSGSQFFVVTGADAGLPPDYAILGKVTKGMDAVQRIEALGQAGSDGPPSRPVVIKRLTVSVS